MEEQVKKALEEIRPSLQSHGGDVEFVGLEEGGVVKVRLTGHCAHCPMAQQTLTMGVERSLKEKVEGVTKVVAA